MMKRDTTMFPVITITHHEDDLSVALPNSDATSLTQIRRGISESGMDDTLSQQDRAALSCNPSANVQSLIFLGHDDSRSLVLIHKEDAVWFEVEIAFSIFQGEGNFDY